MSADFSKWRALLLDLPLDFHPDRWRAMGLTPEAGARVISCRRAREALSLSLGRLSPGADSLDGWEEALSGDTALYSGKALTESALRLGSARFYKDIAHMVLKKDVADFCEKVGEDVRLFALRQAPILLRGVVLEEPAESASRTYALSIGEKVMRSAGLALGCFLSSFPEGIAARVRLKLPPSFDATSAESLKWDSPMQERWRMPLEKILAYG
jgi:hypothetical protein